MLVIATGGTIAGVQNDPDDADRYRAGSLTAEQILASVPDLKRHARIESQQFSNVASPLIAPTQWIAVSRRIGQVLKERDDIAGVVVTHGTDRLEETNWLHQFGCLLALGELTSAMDHSRRMRKAVPDPGELVALWEFVALIAMGDVSAAEKIEIRSSKWREGLVAPLLDHLRGRQPSFDIPRDRNSRSIIDEMIAYGLLATGAVDSGLELLDRCCVDAETLGYRHWLSFRLPIFRSLFAAEVHEHPEYQRIVTSLGLDTATRVALQHEVAELSALTGIVPARLMEI